MASSFVTWNGTVIQPVTITDGVHNVAIASGIPNTDAMGLVVRSVPSGVQEIAGTVTVSGVSGITVQVSGLTNLAINNFPANQQVFGSVTLSGAPAITYATPATDIYTEAPINFSTVGDNIIVSGFGSQTVRVFSLFYVVNGANDLTYKFGATAANEVGPMNFSAGSAMVLDKSPSPWFTSIAGSGFIINASSNKLVTGRIYYLQS